MKNKGTKRTGANPEKNPSCNTKIESGQGTDSKESLSQNKAPENTEHQKAVDFFNELNIPAGIYEDENKTKRATIKYIENDILPDENTKDQLLHWALLIQVSGYYTGYLDGLSRI